MQLGKSLGYGFPCGCCRGVVPCEVPLVVPIGFPVVLSGVLGGSHVGSQWFPVVLIGSQ